MSCIIDEDDDDGKRACMTKANATGTEDYGWGYCNDNCMPGVTWDVVNYQRGIEQTIPDKCKREHGLYKYNENMWWYSQISCHFVCGDHSYKCGNLCTWNDWDCKCGDVTLTSDSEQICDLPPRHHCTYDEIDSDGDAVNPVCPTGKPVDRFMVPPVLTNHGDWGEVALCSPSNYVVGMRLKIQNKQGFWKDDTSLNGIRLICSDGAELVSAEGSKGAWNKPTMTRQGDLITGVALRSDEDSASDNAATSGVRFWAGGHFRRTREYNAGYVEFGEWQESKHCPGNTVIVGFATQVEEYKTFNDNTGLNGVIFVCGT